MILLELLYIICRCETRFLYNFSWKKDRSNTRGWKTLSWRVSESSSLLLQLQDIHTYSTVMHVRYVKVCTRPSRFRLSRNMAYREAPGMKIMKLSMVWGIFPQNDVEKNYGKLQTSCQLCKRCLVIRLGETNYGSFTVDVKKFFHQTSLAKCCFFCQEIYVLSVADATASPPPVWEWQWYHACRQIW